MDRPLPYLIGSQAFMEQDDVGLGDLSSDGKIFVAVSPGVLIIYFPPHVHIFFFFLSRSVCRQRQRQRS